MKKTIIMLAALALSLTMVITGTIAYFTDTEEAINVMTAGKVDIVLNEQQRTEDGSALEDFEQGKELMPIVGSAQGDKDNFGLPTAENYVDKIVTVTNKNNSSDAYVRVLVAVPTNLEGELGTANENPLHWSYGNRFFADGSWTADNASNADWNNWDYTDGETVEIDGMDYNLYAFTYQKALEPGETTASAPFVGFYLDARVDWDDETGMYTMNGETIDYDLSQGVKIPVFAQAVQAAGFGTPEEAFTAAGMNKEDGSAKNPWTGSLSVSFKADTSWYDASASEYTLNNASELFGLAKLVNEEKVSFSGKTIKLGADINLMNSDWEPIGQTGSTTFLGNFDGQGHTISNLKIDSSDETGAHYSSALFGWIETHGPATVISNLNVKGASVIGHHNTAVIAGYTTEKVEIENCHVSNAAINCTKANNDADGDKVGTIIGNATVEDGVKVINCSAKDCTVSAGRDAGQIVGAGVEANVIGCTATNVTVSANGTGTGNNIRNEFVGRVLK